MSLPSGYNPMRWNCEKSGCYNIKHRPKIEQFAASLPRKIGMTDVDAMVEVGGRFLLLEFKGEGVTQIPTGQRIALERLSSLSDRITIVAVSGNAETMDVRAIQTLHSGKWSGWQICNMMGLQQRIHAWAIRCEQKKAAA